MDGIVIDSASLADKIKGALGLQAPVVPPLPALREELRLLPAAANHDGSPAWMVHDPVNNRFFRIGWMDFELLLRWCLFNRDAVVNAVNNETTLHVDVADVDALVLFLEHHNLLKVNTLGGVNRLNHLHTQMQKNPYEWLLHNYLFFRIPLVRPQLWLAALMPYLSWIFTRVTALGIGAITLTGLFLVFRQWETFTSTAVEHLTWQGFFGYAVALIVAKTLHEVGHAVTATYHGVRVAHMGVAMLVLFPMLYTDTSESWKLTNPKKRLAIASAGILTELAIAGVATLAWSLSPEGSFKSALFFLATTSWILTVLLNLSPFMRFDGYFILTDILDFPNLHERSGSLARTWMRRTFLGFNDAYAERTPGHGNALLIAFALATWIYRLTLFLGIALLVYYFFFKVLGIFLMIVELVWFIAKPVWTELSVWRARKDEIKANRRTVGWGLLAGLLLIGFVPWQTSIHTTGWVHAEKQQAIYAPLAGRLVAITDKSNTQLPVKQGELIFSFDSSDLRLGQEKAVDQADARAQELLGLSGVANGEERRAQLQSQENRFLAEAEMYRGEQYRLQILAPFSGILRDVDPQLAAGVWVQSRQPLAMVVDPTSWTIETYVAEADVARVQVGDSVRAFMGSRALTAYSGRVIEVDTARTTVLPHSILDAKAGGPFATLAPNADDRRERVPKDAIYRVRIALDDVPLSQSMMLARVSITAESQAWLPTMFSRMAAVAVRESGF